MFQNSAPKCRRCNKSVYKAEEMIGAGAKWHKTCFRCKDCGKRLDSTTLNDRDGEIYCNGCYGKSFAPTGYGYGQGAGALKTTSNINNNKINAASSSSAAVSSSGSKFCGSCGANVEGVKFCPQCGNKNVGSSNAAPSYQAKASNFNQNAPVQRQPAARPAFGAPKMNVNSANPPCGRCGKPVYHAEKAIGAGRTWHKTCFRCKDCGKRLDSTTVRDNEGEIYCDSCHSKQFGPKGFGYGLGSGALKSTGK